MGVNISSPTVQDILIRINMSTTAMAYLKGLADLVNLDAPLLIAYDPFNAISYGEESVVNVPERANSGALLKAR